MRMQRKGMKFARPFRTLNLKFPEKMAASGKLRGLDIS